MKLVALPFGSSLSSRLLGHASTGRGRGVSLAIAAASVGLLGYCTVDAMAWNARVDEFGQRLQASKTAAELAALPQAAPKTLTAEQVRAYNEMISRLNAPWSDIFDGLEEQVEPNVALLSIEPDAAKAVVRLDVEARSLADTVAYARRLGQSSRFRGVELIRHEIDEHEPSMPVKLQLEASMQAAHAASAPSQP